MEVKVPKPVKFNFCTSSFLYNSIQTYKTKNVIIDARDVQHYHRHHFTPSIHISSQKLQTSYNVDPNQPKLDNLKAADLSDTLNDAEKVLFATRKRSNCFIVMCESYLPDDLIKMLKMEEMENLFEIDEKLIMEKLQERSGTLSEMPSVSLALEVYKVLKRDKVSEVHILLDSVCEFLTRYPYMNHVLGSNIVKPIESSATPGPEVKKVADTVSLPHDIFAGRLFLGSFKHASTIETVKTLNITHILNVTMECENIYEGKGISYLKTSILDESDKEINRFFEKCYSFIESALKSNENHRVLVHCAMGKSRSATMVIMFMMKRFSWGFERALNYVKHRRHIIDPNEGFRSQLFEFEQNGCIFIQPEPPINSDILAEENHILEEQGKVIG